MRHPSFILALLLASAQSVEPAAAGDDAGE